MKQNRAATGLRIRLIGAPVEAGATTRGCVMGPTSLRIAGMVGQLTSLGHHIEDAGDLHIAPLQQDGNAEANAHNWAEVAAWARALSDAVLRALDDGLCPVVLGGDHSLSIGSVNGAARHWQRQGRRLSVIWLDAHADFNTPATSPSGNMHGMPVAAFSGEPTLKAILGDERYAPVPTADIHMFGIRSVDPDERRLLQDCGVNVIDMRHVDEEGIAAPLRRVLEQVAVEGGVLHVSFDVDFLDPALAPAVGTTVPGGASFREAHLVMEMLHDSKLVRSIDVAELNPFLDERGRTALLAVDLVGSLFGRQVFDRPTLPRRG